VLPHQLYHLLFCQAKLVFDRFKRRPVFPGHFYDSVNVAFRQNLLKANLFFLGICFQFVAISQSKAVFVTIP
jgi:hypothetical protein